jgi:hypothetical protein
MRGAVKDAQKPLPTSVLMSNPEMAEDDEAQSTSSRPQGRILCYQEVRSSPTEFHSSFVGLWALQIIVVSAVLACVAEGVHLGKRW